MEVACPDCGARFWAPETVKTFTCPYCGLIFGERAEEDHYYFPVMDRDPYATLLDFLRRQFGIPSDISSSSSLKVRELHYVPVYFYYLHGRASGRCGGAGWTRAEESLHVGIIASQSFRNILGEYPFPVRGKRFFKSEIMSRGTYHKPEFGEEVARKNAEKLLHDMLRDELRRQCSEVNEVKIEDMKASFRGLVHYPIYYLEYSYGGDRYSSYIDGVDGKIILAEHPIKIQTRTTQIIVSALLIAIAFSVGLSISLFLENPLPLISSIIPATAASIPLLRRSFTKKITSSELRVIEEKPQNIVQYLRKIFS